MLRSFEFTLHPERVCKGNLCLGVQGECPNLIERNTLQVKATPGAAAPPQGLSSRASAQKYPVPRHCARTSGAPGLDLARLWNKHRGSCLICYPAGDCKAIGREGMNSLVDRFRSAINALNTGFSS